MAGKYSVKETKDVLALSKVIAVSILKAIKVDGFQVEDLGAFLKAPEFESVLAEALKDINLVPAEVGELDLMDDFDLGRYALSMIQELRSAVK